MLARASTPVVSLRAALEVVIAGALEVVIAGALEVVIAGALEVVIAGALEVVVVATPVPLQVNGIQNTPVRLAVVE